MPKIFIDTNVFIKFYHASNQPLTLFEDLKNYGEHLVFPEQAYDEFRRNSGNQLNIIIKEFQSSSKVNIKATKLITDWVDYSEMTKALKIIKDESLKILEILKEAKEDQTRDPVFTRVQEIYDISTKIPITDEILVDAQKRHLRGNPPGADKHSAGDEIIWESLLSSLSEDLIIVSYDGTFSKHESFLINEFKEKLGYKLTITDQISSALENIGQTPSKAITEYDDYVDRWLKTEFDRCPSCGTSDTVYNGICSYCNFITFGL